MSGNCGRCGAGAGGCGCAPFEPTVLTPHAYQSTLARRLVPVADRLRNLNTRFGLRPYVVRQVRTRWSGGEQGVGAEVVEDECALLPTPKVESMDGLSEILQPIGLDENGSLRVTEISGSYSEDDLLGLVDGKDPEEGQQIYYEIEFMQANGAPSVRRRFTLAGAPVYKPDEFQWVVTLAKSISNRERNGDPA